MAANGKEDLRIQRTKEAIHKTFEEMICEMDYEQIQGSIIWIYTTKKICTKDCHPTGQNQNVLSDWGVAFHETIYQSKNILFTLQYTRRSSSGNPE